VRPLTVARAAIAAIAVATVLASCGGGGGGGSAGGGGDGGDLPALATQAEQFLNSQIESLSTVQNKADLIQQLNDAQDAAHALSNDIEDADVPPELINIRAELGLAMRTVTLDIGRVRANVEGGDIPGALELLANLRSIQALRDAIAAVRSAG
jgi:hypothetical protein